MRFWGAGINPVYKLWGDGLPSPDRGDGVDLSDRSYSYPWNRPLTRPATAGENAVAVHPLPSGEGKPNS
jgi:hypothetical protein